MEIWLKKDNSSIQLPVLPESFEISSSQNNQVVNINSLGDINLHGNTGLKTITLSSFFPSQKYYFNACKHKKPYKYVETLDKWKNSGYVRLIITGVINMLCTIDTFTYGESDGNGDVNYTLELTEYKTIKAKSTKKTTPSKNTTKITTAKTSRETKTIKSTKYTVKKGDTLTAIAKKITGSSSNWRAIYNQNKKVIGDNPNYIRPGMELTIKVD